MPHKKTDANDAPSCAAHAVERHYKSASGTVPCTPDTSREGHKQRLIQAVLKDGDLAFQNDDSKWLELMLTFAIPRRGQRATAHALLERFKTLPGVMDASPAEWREIEGVGKGTAAFFSCIRAFMARYLLQQPGEHDQMSTTRKIADYARMKLGNASEENFLLFILDRRFNLLKTEVIATGSTGNVVVFPSTIAKRVLLEPKAAAIAICHNHPAGSLEPSADDDAVTRRVLSAMDTIGITLLDHVIVTNFGHYSYRCEDLKQPVGKRILKPL